ncbi:DNA ligase D [Stenotrophomonas sp. MMGLT7]|uniref:DNA ligase D n=1 Tax=Stenotrophomonas sp. MMGLT7 TaxID=2901227 RepID=UPI001E37E625|nr:DNA ligase D [Stenotrophomonas sp. MMGLT7]MCD7098529.1 DNA ligase D [Stenotrophomonas sp. MMGLT7]
MSLRDYVRKRRFDRTPEPAAGPAPGTSAARSPKAPIFVVQLHHASSRHYDFRLQAGGVLKSWAVPKGPSLRPGDKRLAVQVEDHPLGYATFEGDIPAGQYGAGHVDVFDHGTWSCQGDPLQALASGKLDFELQGDKLRGAWTLVRTRMTGRQPQWLLIKRHDGHAADVEADDLVQGPAPAPEPGRGRAARSGRRAAAAATDPPAAPAKAKTKTAAKGRARGSAAAARARQDWRAQALALDGARDAPCPAGLAPQLCTLVPQAPEGEDWLNEIKWDGYRLLADRVDGTLRLRSRNGLDWTARVPAVAEAVAALPVDDLRLDGELVVLDAEARSDFSALQAVLEGSARQPLRYVVFDLLGVAGVDLRRTPLLQRKQLLQALLGPGPGVLAYSDHVVGHGREVYAAAAAKGYEGIVSKRAAAPYGGGRDGDWRKTKRGEGDEFVVVGYTDPKGARSGFGSLLLARLRDGALQYVGRVGSGFDEATLARLSARLQSLATAQAQVELPPHVTFPLRSVHWVRPQLVVEVAFRGWAKEGLLRQASFRRERPDKRLADLASTDTDPPAPSAGAAAPPRRPPSRDPTRRARATGASAMSASATVAITHPERVVYPAAGISKGQVADYYRKVARWLLPEVARRPLSLLRCPDGAGGECFFQKHHGRGLGAHVHAIALEQKSGVEDYLYIDDADGLLELVQMNVLELHPWGATVDDPEHPDRLVFDLDPGPGVDWTTVKQAARDIRARLREAGLESFVRLSGGKGLHVVAPIVPGPDWDSVRGFCQAFAQALAEHAPERYIATMSKARREGVIFVDWLRNGRGNTSVCSWSLRAREHASVAMPLRWEELGGIDSPQAFALDKALQRAARLRRDPWDGIKRLRQALPG